MGVATSQNSAPESPDDSGMEGSWQNWDIPCPSPMELWPNGSDMPWGAFNGTNITCNGTEGYSTSPIVVSIITALYAVVCVVGLIGNILVMYVILRYTKMKTATNIYIFNLALADALATSTLPFQSADYMLGRWPFGPVLCKVVMSIDYYNMFTSIFTLTMMSVDRYIAVCHPVKALDFRTPTKAKLINVAIWLLSSIIGVPIMIMGTIKPDQFGYMECLVVFPPPSWFWETLLKICVFIFAFIMPVVIITICYGLMILRLRTVRLFSGSKEKDRNLRRITRMVLVVVAVFIVCWTPIHLFVIAKALMTIQETPFVAAAWYSCVALGYTNSCLNPVLYAFLDENFKRCFKEFCFPAGGGGGGSGGGSGGRRDRATSSSYHRAARAGGHNNNHAGGGSGGSSGGGVGFCGAVTQAGLLSPTLFAEQTTAVTGMERTSSHPPA
ncbi:delta-type opioid receptor-like [Lethenteron reissneri]|uniref:delta-type opioid receptor-like n=1 Tax=Lethenteron reissneri TaxID=7753 RepID=UPI002AB67F9B|nr:delta-type opioid receptor-like [Lethenteron reissneri]